MAEQSARASDHWKMGKGNVALDADRAVLVCFLLANKVQ